MNKPLAILLICVAVCLLLAGYTSSWRYATLTHPHEERVNEVWHEYERTNGGVAPFEKSNEHLSYLTETQTASLNGTMEYCAGWIVLAIAFLTFVIPAKAESQNNG